MYVLYFKGPYSLLYIAWLWQLLLLFLVSIFWDLSPCVTLKRRWRDRGGYDATTDVIIKDSTEPMLFEFYSRESFWVPLFFSIPPRKKRDWKRETQNDSLEYQYIYSKSPGSELSYLQDFASSWQAGRSCSLPDQFTGVWAQTGCSRDWARKHWSSFCCLKKNINSNTKCRTNINLNLFVSQKAHNWSGGDKITAV